MKSIFRTAATMIAIIAFGYGISNATPLTRTPRIYARERLQQARIYEGIRRGTLTRDEAWRLERQEARIRTHEYFAKADGRFGRFERRCLNRELDRTSCNIYRLNHNRRDRVW